MGMKTVKYGALTYVAAENIAAPHGFTTRLGGVSSGYLASLNLGQHRGDSPENVAENYRRLGEAIGFSTEQLVLTRQTHSDIVRQVGSRDAAGLDHRSYPECDALITNEPGVGLMVFTADCTPILLHDPVTGAVGAAHAGWRGTAAGIAAKTVDAMVRAFGSRPADICAAIGPNIAQCCFETDADVPEAMVKALGDAAEGYIRKVGCKYYVNLKGLNEVFLRRAGVVSIAVSGECTACQPEKYWSHRVTRGERGAQGAVIVCKEVGL